MAQSVLHTEKEPHTPTFTVLGLFTSTYVFRSVRKKWEDHRKSPDAHTTNAARRAQTKDFPTVRRQQWPLDQHVFHLYYSSKVSPKFKLCVATKRTTNWTDRRDQESDFPLKISAFSMRGKCLSTEWFLWKEICRVIVPLSHVCFVILLKEKQHKKWAHCQLKCTIYTLIEYRQSFPADKGTLYYP